MDFTDFDQTFKIETKILFWESIFDFETHKFAKNGGSKTIVYVQVNEVGLQDNPLVNPWDTNPGSSYQFLSYQDQEEQPDPTPGLLFAASIQLTDIKVIRSRSVYDVITFISEVSGFSDIFFLIADMIIGTLYTPFLLEAALHKYMGPSIARKKKNRKNDPTTDKAGI